MGHPQRVCRELCTQGLRQHLARYLQNPVAPAGAGTDSEELLGSPFYVGARHQRVRGEAYDELLAELLEAVKLRFGNSTLIHFQARVPTSLPSK